MILDRAIFVALAVVFCASAFRSTAVLADLSTTHASAGHNNDQSGMVAAADHDSSETPQAPFLDAIPETPANAKRFDELDIILWHSKVGQRRITTAC
jgi:hypothetical protein